MRRERSPEAGLTLIELMISTVLIGVTAAFAFTIYSQASIAYRAQSRVAETQQTLRAAGRVLERDLRAAGYMLSIIKADVATGVAQSPVTFVDNVTASEGADMIRVSLVDLSKQAKVLKSDNPGFKPAQCPAFPSSNTCVESTGGLVDGDIVAAVKTCGAQRGQGCVIAVTGVLDTGANIKIQHNPGQGAPWNSPGFSQCDEIKDSFYDGCTIFAKFQTTAYRVKPADVRGVLQVSYSGGVANDWQDLALGVVDMQVAIRYHDTTTADLDGDGDATLNWFSGSVAPPTTAIPTVVRVSLLARTSSEVDSAVLTEAPAFFNPAMPANYNDTGNRPAFDLPVATSGSKYAGRYLYRWATTTVDLRNLGKGL